MPLFNLARTYTLLTGWCTKDLAASQTAVILGRPIVTQGNDANPRMVMPAAGCIVGISVGASADRTAGTATFEVYKTDVATGLTCALNGTTARQTATTQGEGLDTFSALDYIDVRVTTDGDWAPTTSEIQAHVLVRFD